MQKNYPAEEKYALCYQSRMVSVSVPSKIAEGMSRYSNNGKIYFGDISNGSSMETMCQIDIGKRLVMFWKRILSVSRIILAR